MPENYNLCQQAFVLSMRSNWLATLMANQRDTKQNLERLLYQHLDQFLTDPKNTPDMGEGWKIVWGPAVFALTGIADNVAYVAQKAVDPPIYVVATAGTNKFSVFGENDEDGQVATTTTWKQAFKEDFDGNTLLGDYNNPTTAPNPCLSTGTALGVRCLLRTRPDPQTNPNDVNPVELFNYLKNLPANQGTLIITGHSLGGALSPALALALLNPNGGPVNKANWGNVYVLPTAGATPGNDDFASAFATVFPPIPANPPTNPDPSQTEFWNQNIANPHDIVPLAWVPEEMAKIPPDIIGLGGIYRKLNWTHPIITMEEVRLAIGLAKQRSTNGAASTPYGGSTATGPYTQLNIVSVDCDEIDANDTVANLGDYLAHWLKQHVQGYIEEIFQVKNSFPEIQDNALFSGAWAHLLASRTTEPE